MIAGRFASVLLIVAVQDVPTLTVEPARPRVGDRVVVSATLPTKAGETVRLARPCEVDGAFAQVEPLIDGDPTRAGATLRIEMVAAAAGTFRVGPFTCRVDDGGNASQNARDIETGSVEIEVAPGWPAGARPEFGEWRGPLRPADRDAGASGWWWAAAATAAAVAIAAWIARRRQRRRPASVPMPKLPTPGAWRDELARLAAEVPIDLEPRRRWWGALSDVVRIELARRSPTVSRDRTADDLVDGASAALLGFLRQTDDGKFARASADAVAAMSAIAAARGLLESTSEASRAASP